MSNDMRMLTMKSWTRSRWAVLNDIQLQGARFAKDGHKADGWKWSAMGAHGVLDCPQMKGSDWLDDQAPTYHSPGNLEESRLGRHRPRQQLERSMGNSARVFHLKKIIRVPATSLT